VSEWSERQKRHFDLHLSRYHGTENAHFSRVLEAFLTFSDIPSNSRILELGCGDGRYTIPLLQRGFRVKGIDISKESILQLVSRAQKKGVAEHLATQVGDIDDLELEDSFDVVLCIHLLHHVEDITAAMAIARNHLNPGGKFLALEPNPTNPVWFYYALKKGWEMEKGFRKCSETHLIKCARAAGFQTVDVQNYGALPPLLVNLLPGIAPVERFFPRLPICRALLALHFLKAYGHTAEP
jgi:SAM-dependent methyltransferase